MTSDEVADRYSGGVHGCGPDSLLALFADDRGVEARSSCCMSRRFGTSDAVAGVTLCPGAAGGITGQTDPVNGGSSLAA